MEKMENHSFVIGCLLGGNYKGTIVEPLKTGKAIPDKYDTMMIPAQTVMGSPSLVAIRDWAALILPRCSKGAYCVIERIDRVEVERITQEEATNAAADK